MPCFRGLELAIIAQPSSQTLPEFPHPDGSSVRLLSPSNTPSSSQASKAKSLGADDKDSRRVQKANPCISVYVPSAPGSQFWIHYSVKRAPEPQCQLYFKLLMNGRSITSWGINPAVHQTGSIKRALYEPCDRWHYKENGLLLKREGIETRYFHFLQATDDTCVAEDGGLIEVQVFRATGRKRRAPVLPPHRSQDSYGIASPSGGLLECPEEAFYYDWSLIDPKDSPYAVFRFHYRSWGNLLQLSLVPRADDDGEASTMPLRGNSRPQSKGPLKFDIMDGVKASVRFPSPHLADGSERMPSERIMMPKATDMTLPLHARIPHGLTIKEMQSMPSEVRQRPLPEIPHTRLVVKKSFESCAPSIAPSLLTYVESTEVEDFEIGMATRVPIRSDSLPPG